jgi:hypothetical protein
MNNTDVTVGGTLVVMVILTIVWLMVAAQRRS